MTNWTAAYCSFKYLVWYLSIMLNCVVSLNRHQINVKVHWIGNRNESYREGIQSMENASYHESCIESLSVMEIHIPNLYWDLISNYWLHATSVLTAESFYAQITVFIHSCSTHTTITTVWRGSCHSLITFTTFLHHHATFHWLELEKLVQITMINAYITVRVFKHV